MVIKREKENSKIFENAFMYDQSKAAGLASKYSSFQEMMEKEFNMKEGSHYDFSKKAGKMSIWSGALKSRSVRAAAFLNAVDATFLRAGTLVRDLQPDADGTIYNPKFVSGTTAGSTGTPIRKGSSPGSKAKPGQSVSGKDDKKKEEMLPENEKYDLGAGNSVEIKFLREVRFERYEVEIKGVKSSVKTEISGNDFSRVDKDRKRTDLVKVAILPNSEDVLGIGFPAYVSVRGVSFEATLDPDAFAKDSRELEFIIRSMERQFKINPFQLRFRYSAPLIDEIAWRIQQHLIREGRMSEEEGITLSPDKATMVRRKRDPKLFRINRTIAEWVARNYGIRTRQESEDNNVEFDASLVLDENDSVVAVELIVMRDVRGLSRNEKRETEKEIIDLYKNRINRGHNRISRRGESRQMQYYVAFEVVDIKLVRDIINRFKLDESFGFKVSEKMNEYRRSNSSSAFMDEVFEKYFRNMGGVDVFEVEERGGEGFECYFIFSPEVKAKEIKKMVREYGINAVYDDDVGAYIGSCELKGKKREVESIREGYFR